MKNRPYRVLIDPREQDDERVNQIIKKFGKSNCKLQTLEYGDYQAVDVATGEIKAVVEWKSAPDFIASVIDVRVFNQAKDMAQRYNKHYVFIESDLKQHIFKTYNPDEQANIIFQMEGAIASINDISNVIECGNLEHAIHRLKLCFDKATDTHPRYLTRIKKDKDFLHCALLSIRNVSYERAKLIIEHYKLESFGDLYKLKEKDFLAIDGIGKGLCHNLMLAIHGTGYNNK